MKLAAMRKEGVFACFLFVRSSVVLFGFLRETLLTESNNAWPLCTPFPDHSWQWSSHLQKHWVVEDYSMWSGTTSIKMTGTMGPLLKKKNKTILEIHSILNRHRASLSGFWEVEFLTSILSDSEVQ